MFRGVSVLDVCRAARNEAAMPSVFRFRDFVVGDLAAGAVDLVGLLAVLALRLPRTVLWTASIHAERACELNLALSGMTMPFSWAIFSASSICAGVAGFNH
jgi:hypothetical protein